MSALHARVPGARSALRLSGRLLGALLLLTLPTARARGQPPEEPAEDRLPVSFTGFTAYSFALGEEAGSLVFAGSFTYRLSPRVGLGVGMRTWQSRLGPEACSAFEDVCVYNQDTDALAGLAFVSVYPFRARQVYARLGIGVTLLQERTAVESTIRERRSMPFTVLGGIGWDVPIAPHLFLTPTIELIRSSVHEKAIRSTTSWTLQIGFGGTVG